MISRGPLTDLHRGVCCLANWRATSATPCHVAPQLRIGLCMQHHPRDPPSQAKSELHLDIRGRQEKNSQNARKLAPHPNTRQTQKSTKSGSTLKNTSFVYPLPKATVTRGRETHRFTVPDGTSPLLKNTSCVYPLPKAAVTRGREIHRFTAVSDGTSSCAHLLSTQCSKSRLYAGWSAVARRFPGAKTWRGDDRG